MTNLIKTVANDNCYRMNENINFFLMFRLIRDFFSFCFLHHFGKIFFCVGDEKEKKEEKQYSTQEMVSLSESSK